MSHFLPTGTYSCISKSNICLLYTSQLVPTIDGHQVPAFEIMTVTPAIRNMIRDNKIPQIDGMIYSSATPELV